MQMEVEPDGVVQQAPDNPVPSMPMLGAAKKKKTPVNPMNLVTKVEKKRLPRGADPFETSRKAAMKFQNDLVQFEEDQRGFQKQIREAMGLVTRVVDRRSREAQDPDAMEAVEIEVQNLKRKAALDFERMLRKSVIIQNIQNAEFVRGMMILGVKHEELGREYRKWKARFVALGNNVKDIYDRLVIEKVI